MCLIIQHYYFIIPYYGGFTRCELVLLLPISEHVLIFITIFQILAVLSNCVFTSFQTCASFFERKCEAESEVERGLSIIDSKKMSISEFGWTSQTPKSKLKSESDLTVKGWRAVTWGKCLNSLTITISTHFDLDRQWSEHVIQQNHQDQLAYICTSAFVGDCYKRTHIFFS